jgi:hypothetical protein
LDGLKQQICDPFFDICFEGHIDLHGIPPHFSGQIQPCDLSLFTAAKNIHVRLPKDPDLDKQCQDIDRLVSVIKSASTIKNIRKGSKRVGIRLEYADHALWRSLDLANRTKVRRFTGQRKPSPR